MKTSEGFSHKNKFAGFCAFFIMFSLAININNNNNNNKTMPEWVTELQFGIKHCFIVIYTVLYVPDEVAKTLRFP